MYIKMLLAADPAQWEPLSYPMQVYPPNAAVVSLSPVLFFPVLPCLPQKATDRQEVLTSRAMSHERTLHKTKKSAMHLCEASPK